MSVMLYPSILLCCSVNGSVCLVSLTVFVNCLMKQFAMCGCYFVVECNESV